MEKKINIAELLKDCPSGMELDCTICDKFVLVGVDNSLMFPIKVKCEDGCLFALTKYGQCCDSDYAKCVIFPKGKTTWEGFVPPCQFKDGDVIFTHTNALKCNLDNNWVSIFKEYRNNRCACYVCLCLSDLELYHDKWEDELLCELCEIEESRLATEEEKQRLFQAIKDNGYKWNTETKTLEKLPRFKVGDRIKEKQSGVTGEVIDVQQKKYNVKVDDNKGLYVYFREQDNWELLPNKFDINTLKPFDKVLVRNKSNEVWTANFYSHYDATSDKPFICVGWSEMNEYRYCIPYEGNEHLLGKTDDCSEYYKTWE